MSDLLGLTITLKVMIPEDVLREDYAKLEAPTQTFEEYVAEQPELLADYACGWWMHDRLTYEVKNRFRLAGASVGSGTRIGPAYLGRRDARHASE